jgi:hypothetical protein
MNDDSVSSWVSASCCNLGTATARCYGNEHGAIGDKLPYVDIGVGARR